MRTLDLPGLGPAPVMGQGTWRMGERAERRRTETDALRLGVELGMTVIDTAEMYGDGATESFLGEALAGLRDRVTLVSKVYPHNAGRGRIEPACEASLKRLRTDRLDLYLLHWRGSVPLAETVEGMEALRRAGKIRAWGVSNLDPNDMRELAGVGGAACATDQVLYNITRRGPEFDLLPALAARGVPVTAYSPVEQGRLPSRRRAGASGRAPRRHALPGRPGVGGAGWDGAGHPQGGGCGACARQPRGRRPAADRRRPGRAGHGVPAAQARHAPRHALDVHHDAEASGAPAPHLRAGGQAGARPPRLVGGS